MNSLHDRCRLSNGVEIPWLGLGTYKGRGEEVEGAVREALKLGYRCIDTASAYGNESDIARALRYFPRQDVFVITKVWNSEQGYDATLRAFDSSCARLGLEHLDLYLVHWPVPARMADTWRALERLYKEGRSRAVGVSNFMVHHLQALANTAEVIPQVNQVEFHPHLLQPDLRQYCRSMGIRLQAWSPLMRGRVAELTEVQSIARRHGKSEAQVVLRWDLQHGVLTIPKTVRPERLAENADIFDFVLTEDDMLAIDRLDRGQRYGPDPDDPPA